MKRINLNPEVKFDVIFTRSVENRLTATFNGGGRQRCWIVVVRFEGRSFAFPYRRGSNLLASGGIDPAAVFRSVMLEQAALAVSDTSMKFYSLMWGPEAHVGIGAEDTVPAKSAFVRAIKMQAGLKRVLGAEYDRCLQIVLSNLQERAHAPATT